MKKKKIFPKWWILLAIKKGRIQWLPFCASLMTYTNADTNGFVSNELALRHDKPFWAYGEISLDDAFSPSYVPASRSRKFSMQSVQTHSDQMCFDSIQTGMTQTRKQPPLPSISLGSPSFNFFYIYCPAFILYIFLVSESPFFSCQVNRLANDPILPEFAVRTQIPSAPTCTAA